PLLPKVIQGGEQGVRQGTTGAWLSRFVSMFVPSHTPRWPVGCARFVHSAADGASWNAPWNDVDLLARRPDSGRLEVATCTTDVCIRTTYPGDLYATWSGTSFAAPYATGTIALCIVSGPCAGKAPAHIMSIITGDAT